MRLNPLMTLARDDLHADEDGKPYECCANHFCRKCGAHVSGYNALGSWDEERRTRRPDAPCNIHRPESAGWDWWVACDNADCEHARGEGGLFQELPEWIKDRRL